MNPVNWWHNLEGGAIAQQRPPPPGANQAYPNLASVPPKPTAPDLKALDAISAGLVADRAHAEHVAAAAPLPDPSSRAASPGLFGVGTAPPPPPPGAASSQPAEAASATMAAATAPPLAPTQGPRSAAAAAPQRGPQVAEVAPHVARAPVGAVHSTPLPGPAAYQPSPAATAMQTAAMPAMPAQPPPPPNVPGAAAAVPAAVTLPAPPPLPAGAVSVDFAPGSAALSSDAGAVLKPLVAKRGAAAIAVTGHGDAAASDPDAQAAALALGLARAKAVASALAAQGVPADAVQVGAQAAGRGATLRLLQ